MARRPLLTKALSRDLARECTNFLRLRPSLSWWQVRDYFEPPMLPREGVQSRKYDPDTSALIAKWLDREFKRLHLWRDPPKR